MNVFEIYHGSDGQATRYLYALLETRGECGRVALNLFRAQKCSSRAKVYHGGIRGGSSYRDMAYDRKQWSMENLCKILTDKAEELGILWGWKLDPGQTFHRWVLYVDIPTGQVSFHTASRGQGPDYVGDWDGAHASAERIIKWVESLIEGG